MKRRESVSSNLYIGHSTDKNENRNKWLDKGKMNKYGILPFLFLLKWEDEKKEKSNDDFSFTMYILAQMEWLVKYDDANFIFYFFRIFSWLWHKKEYNIGPKIPI